MNTQQITDVLEASRVTTEDGSDLYSLTKIHAKLSGKRSKCPYVWLKTKMASETLQVVSELANQDKDSLVIKNYRKSTLVHKTVAAVYMSWLDTRILVAAVGKLT